MRSEIPRFSTAAFTLTEVVIAVAIVGVLAALTLPNITSWTDKRNLDASARTLAKVLSLARGEAIRTGDIHIVFFATDASANALTTPVVMLNDGRPGALNQNCAIDAGEPIQTFSLETGVSYGVTLATAAPPTDDGTGSFPSIATFADGGGNDANWVLFRSNGRPFGFNAACSIGAIGSGSGGVYLTGGGNDVSVVLSALGANRVHAWNSSGGGWTN